MCLNYQGILSIRKVTHRWPIYYRLYKEFHTLQNTAKSLKQKTFPQILFQAFTDMNYTSVVAHTV